METMIEGRSKVVNDGTRRREGEGGRILEGKRETDPSLLFISQLCPRCPSALGRLRIWISREGWGLDVLRQTRTMWRRKYLRQGWRRVVGGSQSLSIPTMHVADCIALIEGGPLE